MRTTVLCTQWLDTYIKKGFGSCVIGILYHDTASVMCSLYITNKPQPPPAAATPPQGETPSPGTPPPGAPPPGALVSPPQAAGPPPEAKGMIIHSLCLPLYIF